MTTATVAAATAAACSKVAANDIFKTYPSLGPVEETCGVSPEIILGVGSNSHLYNTHEALRSQTKQSNN